jgi:hypothetical protein
MNGVRPDQAWELCRERLRDMRFERAPDQWHANPEVHEAIQVAYEACGGLFAIGRADSKEQGRLRLRFCGVYETRHGGADGRV